MVFVGGLAVKSLENWAKNSKKANLKVCSDKGV